MGYDISFDGEVCKFCGHWESFYNYYITFNYSFYFNKYIPGGLEFLDGKKAVDCIEIIKKAIEPNKNSIPDKDGFKPTIGNAVNALKGLLRICEEYPDSIINL